MNEKHIASIVFVAAACIWLGVIARALYEVTK